MRCSDKALFSREKVVLWLARYFGLSGSLFYFICDEKAFSVKDLVFVAIVGPSIKPGDLVIRDSLKFTDYLWVEDSPG